MSEDMKPSFAPKEVVPGPCPPTGCPPPTEIVCIQVEKVYDFCFQNEDREACFTLPVTCVPPAPAGSTATCTITSVTCTPGTPVPVPGQPGFVTVGIVFVVAVSITVLNPDGTTRCTFTQNFTFVKTVVLYAPAGTTIQCEVPDFSCGPCAVADTQVCCTLHLCILVQSKALVKLLVPAYGFCVPAQCVVAPKIPCPPGYPPQFVPAGPGVA